MASVKLILRKDKKLSDNSSPIILQVIKDQKKAITTLPISCDESDWNERTNLPKNGRSSLICQKKLLKLQEIVLDGEDNDWTAKEIIDIFTGKESNSLMFFQYCEQMIDSLDRSFSTKRTMRTRAKRFRLFTGGEIRMNQIDHDLLKAFKRDMRAKRSADRYIQFVRQVYNHAIEYDKFIPKSNPFKKDLFDGIKETRNRNLSIEEIKLVFSLETSGWNRFSGRNLALDFWKLAFLMRGMNAVDLAQIPFDVGDHYIFTRQKLKWKTSAIQKVRIFPEARAILDKYADPARKYILPFLDNDQTIEDSFQSYESRKHVMTFNLKTIQRELRIKNSLSTMSPRYSFINVGKQIGVPFLFIQELVGHKTNTTTDAYLDAFPESQLDEYHRKIIDKIL